MCGRRAMGFLMNLNRGGQHAVLSASAWADFLPHLHSRAWRRRGERDQLATPVLHRELEVSHLIVSINKKERKKAEGLRSPPLFSPLKGRSHTMTGCEGNIHKLFSLINQDSEQDPLRENRWPKSNAINQPKLIQNWNIRKYRQVAKLVTSFWARLDAPPRVTGYICKQ